MSDKIEILLVDDESRNLDALEVILTDPSYSLLRAADADAALRLLIDHDVAAILLDIKMPGTSGFELAQMIKATRRYRQIPILFLTAYLVEDQDIITGYGAGAVDYLTKPLNPQIVRHKVAVFADLFRKTRALEELNEKLEDRVRERTAELEKSEAALRAADRNKDEFIATLAHELRNPLAPLRFGLDILSQQHLEPAVAKTMAAMNRQLNHMVRLIDDLLDMSRIRRGTIELRRTQADLSEIIRTAVEINQPFIARRRHVLSIDADAQAFINGDSTRITQVIGNLLHNAIKFTPEQGSIAIKLRVDGKDAVVSVTDSGEGIAAEQLEQAFAMFARIDRTDSVAERGLGIGLALARRLAEMHSGSLSASSEGSGRGSTFSLRLPMVDVIEKTAIPARSPLPKVADMTALNIVVIEDSEDISDTLSAWLVRLGHQVSVAPTGPSGIEMIQLMQPNLVLCDIGLPGMDGIEVCRCVRKLALAQQPRMIALTGWGREDDRLRTKEAGFDEHLVKPVALALLSTVLRG